VSQSPNKRHNFWKLYTPFLSENTSNSNNKILVQDEKVLSEDLNVAEAFNLYFSDITKDLNLWQWPFSSHCLQFSNPIHLAKLGHCLVGNQILLSLKLAPNTSINLLYNTGRKKTTSGIISPKFLKLSTGIFLKVF